ncbi:MAG: hypothetical protein WA126_15975 [Thermodesulfovibrionales bacterium]
MKKSEPSLKDWKDLYDAAIAFRKIEPWGWMKETDIFGVQNPQTGEVGYCCIMGELGEVLAIAVYLGTEGLDGYLNIRRGQIQHDDPDSLFIQNCLMLSFENRKLVQEDDREIINELGLKFRGKNAWPVFRRYEPGYFPWFLNRDEVLYMTNALQQATDICLRFKDDAKLFRAPEKNQYLIRVAEEKNGRVFWKDERRKPSLPEKKDQGFYKPVDEVRIQRLKKTARSTPAIWEIDFFYAPTPVLEGERPFFPYAIMIMDHDTGFILDMHLAETRSYQKEFLEKFLNCIETTSVIPLEILARKEEAVKLLETYASRLNIRLSRVKKLQNIEHARREMAKHLRRL